MTALLTLLARCAALACALAGAASLGHSAETHPDLVVAPDGDDGWSGTAPRVNAARTDGPFRTLARAQQAVRALKAAAPGRVGAIVVELRGGFYPLSAPWTFTPEDGGSAAAPVVYTAAPGEVPVISGGEVLHGFRVDATGRWVLQLPAVAAGSWTFNQLWVNGERRYRARAGAGYRFIAGERHPSPAAAKHGFDRFRFADGDLDPGWPALADVEVLTFHQWSMSRLRIASIDAGRNTVQFTGATCSSDDWAALKSGWRYLVENVGAQFAQPGQWHLERATGTLVYRPLPGEDPATSEVVAPRCEQLLLIAGDPAQGRFVDHLRFADLTFSHTAWLLPPAGYSCGQAEMAISGALTAKGLRHSAITGCAISHTGGWALDLALGCLDNQVTSCALYDLAAGGIKIGDGGLHDKSEETTQGTVVDNCLIAFAGRMHPAATAVWIGQSHHNTVEHCEIHDLYYSGISLGWTWGYGRSDAHHNTIAFNHISRVGQGVLSDMGGIYTLGVAPGTVFHHNRIHDVVSASYGGWGLYTDEGSSGVLMQDNIVYRTSAAGFHQHYGADNRVINNIFAYGREAQLMRSRDEDHLSFTIERNLVLYRDAPLLGSNWNGGPARFLLNHNLYWNEHGEVTFGTLPLAAWRAKGEDLDSLVADPQFTDPGHGDFSLKPGSPASGLGFMPIAAAAIGLERSHASGRLAAYLPYYDHAVAAGSVAPAFQVAAQAAPPAPILDDFEETPLGAKADGAETSEQADITTATIRVSDQAALSGSRSLRFGDAPGQRNRYDPHLYYHPGFAAGTVEGSFAIRLEAGAEFVHEWRTAGEPYRTGPSLRIANGKLSTAGRELMDIPLSSWVRIAITTALGPEAHGRWQLTVTLPGAQPPRRFAELPCAERFDRLDWYGFVADADSSAVFYLDDVSVRPLVPPAGQAR
jgi:Right handed beta helix region